MSFSSILQMGLGTFGMLQSGQQYRDGLAARYEALAMQRDQYNQNYGSYLDALRAQQEENEYVRQREVMDRMTRGSERDFAERQLYSYLDQLDAERQYGMDRQQTLDRDAARQRQFQLEQLLRNQELSADERRFALEQLRIAQDIASGERDFSMGIYQDEADRLAERQALADEEAREMQLYRLREAARNRDLVASEREFAKLLLGQAQGTAASEREEAMARFLEDRETRAGEREFVVDQYEDLLRQAQAERDTEMGVREQILARAGDLQSALEATAAQLGYVPEIEQITPEMIEAEVARRTGEYQSDVDRAAEAVASVNEADLIRAGLDVSTGGTQRRGDIAARLAQEYQNARTRAYDDAMGYISGRSNAMATNVGNIMDRRAAILGETANIGGAELGILQNLRSLPSATDAYQMAANIASGVLDRNITSANNYNAPIPVSSALYDASGAMTSGMSNYDYNLVNLLSGIQSGNNYRSPVGIGSSIYDGNIGGNYASTLNPSSAASTSGMNLPSTILAPYGQTLQNPMNYLNNANATQNSMISGLMGQYNAGVNALSGASSNFGEILSGISGDYDAGLRTRNNMMQEYAARGKSPQQIQALMETYDSYNTNASPFQGFRDMFGGLFGRTG